MISRQTGIILLIIALVFAGCTSVEKPEVQEPPKQVQKPIPPKPVEKTDEKPAELPLPKEEKKPMQENKSTETKEVKEERFDPKSYGKPHPKVKQPYPDCCNHPYWHQVYRAFSTDKGETWEKEELLIKDHASVPDAIERDDGTVILYYVDGEFDTMDCMIAKDGNTFVPGNCTIYGFTVDKAWDPEVVRLDDGRYRMFFYAPKQRALQEDNRIMSALSEDGISWVQEEGVRLLHKRVLDPSAIKIKNDWFLYTWYPDGDKSIFVISKSSDGLNFIKQKEMILGGGIPDLFQIDFDTYGMHFCEKGISRITSTDGITWSEPEVVLRPSAGSGICDAATITGKDTWTMYYKVLQTK